MAEIYDINDDSKISDAKDSVLRDLFISNQIAHSASSIIQERVMLLAIGGDNTLLLYG